MSQRPKTDFRALIQEVAPSAAPAPAPEPISEQPTPLVSSATAKPAATASAAVSGGTLKQRTRQHTLYLEVPVYEQLREIAHVERCPMQALYLEGIEAVLRKRGAPSIKELMKER